MIQETKDKGSNFICTQPALRDILQSYTQLIVHFEYQLSSGVLASIFWWWFRNWMFIWRGSHFL